MNYSNTCHILRHNAWQLAHFSVRLLISTEVYTTLIKTVKQPNRQQKEQQGVR